MLDCAAWGTPPADLPFPDQPPAGALAAAAGVAGRAWRAGPRRAASPDRAAAWRCWALIRAWPPCCSPPKRRRRRRWPPTSPPCWRSATRCARPTLRPISALRLQAIATGDAAADRGALSRIRRAAAQYRRPPAGCGPPTRSAQPDGDPGPLLAAAFPDRIAQRRGEPGSFRLSGGGGARLPRTDPLANAGLLVVAALEMKASARIRLAAVLDPDALPPVLARG